jgi:quercetin dioxygenase-like cupin family protein
MVSGAPSPELLIMHRPVVSEIEHGPHGRHFTVRFEPGQALPPHRNKARVVISAVEGSGEIVIAGFGARDLPRGAVVQLDPDVEHSIVAGDGGLELRVDLIANCCEHC